VSKKIVTGFARDLIEHINEVKKEDSTCGIGGGVRKKMVYEGLCGMDDTKSVPLYWGQRCQIGQVEV
jgi:hypothetical protein